MPNHKGGNSKKRAKKHLEDFLLMYYNLNRGREIEFMKDYVSIVTEWVPEQYRVHIVSNLKRRYPEFSQIPLP